MAGRFFGIPFAATGDRTVTPDAVQPDGSVSYSEGFGFDYERPNTDPAYKPVPRDGMNGLFFDLTEAMGIVQKQGFADWTTDAQPYQINAAVRHNGVNWYSLIATNNDEPGVGPGATTWTQFVSQSIPASLLTSGIQGSFSNLKASTTGLSALVTVTADSLCLKNPANEQVVLNAVSVTPSLAASGANGLDDGTSSVSTWYSVWVIWNGTATAGLFSLSATSPTLPNGYTHKARIGWVRSDSTSDKYPLAFTQAGRRVAYKVAAGSNLTALRTIISGVQGSPSAGTYVAASLAAFVPPSAVAVQVVLAIENGNNGLSYAIAAPNASYGGQSSATNPPPLVLGPYALNNPGTLMGDFILETQNIYFASAGSNVLLQCYGWEDNL